MNIQDGTSHVFRYVCHMSTRILHMVLCSVMCTRVLVINTYLNHTHYDVSLKWRILAMVLQLLLLPTLEKDQWQHLRLKYFFLDPHEKSLEICQPSPWAYPTDPIPHPWGELVVLFRILLLLERFCFTCSGWIPNAEFWCWHTYGPILSRVYACSEWYVVRRFLGVWVVPCPWMFGLTVAITLSLNSQLWYISVPHTRLALLHSSLLARTYHTHIYHTFYTIYRTTGRLLLADRYPKLKDVVLDEDNITLALNEEYVTGTKPLKQGDVVALIPPISGGWNGLKKMR